MLITRVGHLQEEWSLFVGKGRRGCVRFLYFHKCQNKQVPFPIAFESGWTSHLDKEKKKKKKKEKQKRKKKEKRKREESPTKFLENLVNSLVKRKHEGQEDVTFLFSFRFFCFCSWLWYGSLAHTDLISWRVQAYGYEGAWVRGRTRPGKPQGANASLGEGFVKLVIRGF